MLHYHPAPDATWLALTSDDVALLVRSRDDDVARYWPVVATGDLQAILDALTIGGISTTPDFALVLHASGRVFVRGACAVSLVSSDGSSSELSGVGVSTWTERVVTGITTYTIVAEETADGGEPLPLVAGVVRSAHVVLTTGDATPEVRVASGGVVPAVASVPSVVPVDENTIVESAQASTGYSHLFEQTIVRSVADAAVAPEPDEPELPEPEVTEPEPRAGDHDGETVMSDSVSKLLAGRKREVAESTPQPLAPQMWVQLANGLKEPLDQPLIFGRSPSVSKVSGANIPRLVTIQGDDDISRNHVQFTLEGGTVVVTDLHSRNGTSIIAPGKAPQVLRKGEATSILVGTVVDLGNGTTITVGQD